MAFSILDPNGNLSNQNLPSSEIPLDYSLNTESTWIYCDYPEAIPSDVFGDHDLGNHFLNQATVGQGTHQIFYFYGDTNNVGPYTFGIQVYNPNASGITFRTLHSAHRDTITNVSWGEALGGLWEEFFNSPSSSNVNIAAGSSYWFDTNTIPKSCYFNGSILFEVSDTAVITVYIYKTQWKINGYAEAYPLPSNPAELLQYSGTANGYRFTSESITLNASELTNGKYFHMTYPHSFSSLKIDSVSKTSDLIPIKLVQDGSIISPPTGNLGNWGAQYYFPLKLVNDTNSRKTFSAYVRTDVGGNRDSWPVIQSGSQCKYALINPSTNNSWKWMSQTVDAGETFSSDFQFVLGSNSFGMASMIFRVS